MSENSNLKALGNKHFRDGNFAKAIECFNRALIENGRTSSLLTNLSLAYIKTKNFEDALRCAEEAINLKNDNIKAYYRAYLSCKELERFSLGKSYLKDALRYRPKNKLLLNAYNDFKWFSSEKRIRFLYTADDIMFLLNKNDSTFFKYALLACKSLFSIFQDYYSHVDRSRITGSMSRVTEKLSQWSLTVPLSSIFEVNGLKQYILFFPLSGIDDDHVEKSFCQLEFQFRPFARFILTFLSRFVLEMDDEQALDRLITLSKHQYVRRNCGSAINEWMKWILGNGLNGFVSKPDLKGVFFKKGGLVPIARGIAEYPPLDTIGRRLLTYCFGDLDESEPFVNHSRDDMMEVLKNVVFFKEWYKDAEMGGICRKLMKICLLDSKARSLIKNNCSSSPPKFSWVFNDFCRFVCDAVSKDNSLSSNTGLLFESWVCFKKDLFERNLKNIEKRWKKPSSFGLVLI